MAESSNSTLSLPVATSRDVLTDILRDGAQRLLTQAVEAEVAEWIDQHAHLKNADGHRQVVRNGHLPKRTITTGVGPIEVEQPRVLDRRADGEAEPFSSKILPPYLRKTKSLEELIPWLYLKGVSTGDFNEALTALVGPNCPGLSASTVTRLKSCWEDEFQEWNKRSLEGKQYVYLWADGVHFNIRLEEDRQCILVLMGATADGRKELIAVVDGFREGEQSWKALLLDVKSRGLVVDPKLATGDGALGFQIREPRDLVGRAGPGPGHALDVLAGRGVLRLGLCHGVLLHLVPAGDQVDEHPKIRQDDHEDRPQSFGPSGQIRAAEDVAEDDDQQPDPDEEHEEPEHVPQHLAGPELCDEPGHPRASHVCVGEPPRHSRHSR